MVGDTVRLNGNDDGVDDEKDYANDDDDEHRCTCFMAFRMIVICG